MRVHTHTGKETSQEQVSAMTQAVLQGKVANSVLTNYNKNGEHLCTCVRAVEGSLAMTEVL